MKLHLKLFAIFLILFLLNCEDKKRENVVEKEVTVHEEEAMDFETEKANIIDINRKIIKAMVVDNDVSVFEEYSHDDFRVIAPGGKLENKDQVIKGVNSLNVKAIDFSEEEVIFHGNTAILIGKMDMDGTMQPLGELGPAKYMTVFIRQDGEWVMVSRAITPCAKIAIDRGVC